MGISNVNQVRCAKHLHDICFLQISDILKACPFLDWCKRSGKGPRMHTSTQHMCGQMITYHTGRYSTRESFHRRLSHRIQSYWILSHEWVPHSWWLHIKN